MISIIVNISILAFVMYINYVYIYVGNILYICVST